MSFYERVHRFTLEELHLDEGESPELQSAIEPSPAPDQEAT